MDKHLPKDSFFYKPNIFFTTFMCMVLCVFFFFEGMFGVDTAFGKLSGPEKAFFLNEEVYSLSGLTAVICEDCWRFWRE